MPINSESLTDQLYKIKSVKTIPDSASELDANVDISNLQSSESLTDQLYSAKPITPKPTDWKPEAFQTLLGYENANLASGKLDSSTSYWDNKQYSVGYGTKGKQAEVQSEEQSRIAAQDKFNLSVSQAKNLLPSGQWDSLPDKAKAVLSRLVYQTGFLGAKKFTKTLDSIKNGDYVGAAKEYLDSKLPKDRAQKEAELLNSLSQSGVKPLTDQLANKDLKSLTSQLYNESKVKVPPTIEESSNAVKLSIDPYNVLSPGLITTIGARNYNPEDKAKLDNIIVNNLKDLGALATSPKEIVRGGLELLSSVPGFLTGAAIAASKMGKELMDQIVLGQTLDLNTLHDVATQGMVEGTQITNPIKDAILKPSTPESKYMLQLVMAPLTAMSAIGNKVASYEGFKDHPNIQGAAKFTGDVLGLVALGMIHEGVSKKSPVKDLEDVTNKANDLITEDQNIAATPDEVTKQIQQKVNDIKKSALEKEAAKVAEKIRQDQEIKQTKEDQNTKVDEALDKPKVDKESEPANDEIANTIEEVNKDNNTDIKYLGYQEGFGPVEGFHSFSIPLKDGSETTVSVKDPSELQNAYNDVMEKFGQDRSIVEQTDEPITNQPITDVDRGTGTEVPTLEGKDSPFFQDSETTNKFKSVYESRPQAVAENPETFMQKLVNDVNRWYHGDKSIDIEKVRNGLSELATRSNELRGQFLNGTDFNNWKTLVSEAATWARRINPDRLIIERSKSDHSVTLNAGISLDEIAKAIKSSRRIHPAQFSTVIQKTLTEIANKLNISDILDIFGGVGKIGQIKKYGYEGIIRANEIEPKWGGKSTIELQKSNGVDEPSIGDSRNLNIPDNSVQAIFTSPTYGNQMAQRSPSKMDSYQAFAGGKLSESNTGGEVWSPRYEQLHKEIYNEAYRVVKPGGYFVLNMKDRVSNAKIAKNNWIPKKGSTVEVKNGVMKATDWHIKTLEDIGFKFIRRIKIKEPEARVGSQRFANTVGYEDIVVLRKPNVHSVTLNAGLPLDQIAKEIVDDAKKFIKAYDNSRSIKAFKPLEAARRTREAFNRSIIDRSGNIRIDLLKSLGDEGYRIIQKMYLSKGASSRSAEMLRQMQKEVYNGLSGKKKHILDILILATRMIDIGKYKDDKFKFPIDQTPKKSLAVYNNTGAIFKLTSEEVSDLRSRTMAYFAWMKKPLKDMLDAELISEKEFENLSSHNYRRLKLVDIYDREYKTKIGKKIKTVYDSGVESLARGRDTDIFEPSSEVMALEVFNRAYGRIANNEANKTLLDLATRDPENPFVRIKADKKTKIPTGWNRIFMFDEGKRRALYLSPEMNKEWINSSPELSYKMSQILRYSTGSPVLRTFATGINWGFAVANLPRDIMQTWFAARTFKDGEWSSVYSPVAPLYALQLGHDYSTIFTDAALKKGRYEEYIKEGGGMEFLVHQGRLFQRGRHIERPIDKFYTLMGRFGETSELMTRLAIRERVIRNRARELGITMEEARKRKDITTEATFAARDYMDFGQGGGIAKAFDNGIPYLNAAIQGTRGMVRAFKPGSGTALTSTFKLAQFATVVSGLYIAARKLSPQTMKNLQGNIAMQNNLCIPIGDHFSFVDNEGQTRYIYIKIPLDPGQKFFKTFFEGSVDKWLGNEVDVDRITGALEQLSPVSLTGLPPTLSAALGYMTNKNFWSNSDIWHGTEKPLSWPNSSQEYTERTPQMAVDFGKLTGLSPERTKYAVNQLITNGSIWSYLVGGAYNKLFSIIPKDKKEQNLAMILSRIPVLKRFIGVTNPYSKYRKDINEAKEMSSLKTFIQNRGLDTLSDGYLFKGITKRSEIFKYISSFRDRDIQNRLIERFRVQERTKDLPERSFWLQLQELKPDARAAVFMDRLTRLDRDRKSEVWKEFSMMNRMSKGIFTSRFRHEVSKIKAKMNE